ncbi:MAG: DUF4167 domain-containing protein [Hyphomonas sp.]
MKRSRGRNRRSGGNNNNNHNNPNRHYESVGPDVKIRGSAQQVLEKYLQYARDAQTSGDRVLSEAYYQFAEHYQRIVAKQNEAKEKQQQRNAAEREARREKHNDNRNSGADDAASKDEAPKGEAEVSPRETPVDTTDVAEKAEVDAPDEVKATDADEKPRKPRTRRKTYKTKAEEGADAPGDDDGVRKTLARGRRKKAVEPAETAEAEGSAAETTAE